MRYCACANLCWQAGLAADCAVTLFACAAQVTFLQECYTHKAASPSAAPPGSAPAGALPPLPVMYLGKVPCPSACEWRFIIQLNENFLYEGVGA